MRVENIADPESHKPLQRSAALQTRGKCWKEENHKFIALRDESEKQKYSNENTTQKLMFKHAHDIQGV